MVIDGRPEIVPEIEGAEGGVRAYIAAEIERLLDDPVFLEGLAGFLLPDAASQARRRLLEERLHAIAQSSHS